MRHSKPMAEIAIDNLKNTLGGLYFTMLKREAKRLGSIGAAKEFICSNFKYGQIFPHQYEFCCICRNYNYIDIDYRGRGLCSVYSERIENPLMSRCYTGEFKPSKPTDLSQED